MGNIKIFKDKPIFGLDIGSKSIKVVQSYTEQGKTRMIGYGYINYNSNALENGIIIDFEHIAGKIKELFDNSLIGSITTRRVCMSINSAKTYSRVVSLPKLSKKELNDAIKLEAEQYIPVSIEDLYLDYEELTTNEDSTEYFIVATPKTVVDSYMKLADILGLEVVAIEPTMSASSRLVAQAEKLEVPTIFVDFGTSTTDLTLYDGRPIVTGVINGGGDDFTKLIAEKLDVSENVANNIKNRYGINVSKKQEELLSALQPELKNLIKEIKKMMRYFNEKNNGQKSIQQIITIGGGANMPGLSEYLTSTLRIPARMCHTWNNFEFKKVHQASEIDKTIFVTAAGLSLIDPRGAWK